MQHANTHTEANGLTIHPIEEADHDQWLPVWNDNCDNQLDAKITKVTWQRLCDPANPVNGLIAKNAEGKAIGILHYILHPTTGNIDLVCYMQDLFISADYRRQGIARMLVVELAAIAEKEGWNRIYWLADKNNEAAQNLYKNIGVALDFSLHVLPVNMR